MTTVQVKPFKMTADTAPDIKVKHLVEYLSSLNQEAIVHLDKDGWFAHQIYNKDGSAREMPEQTAVEIVATNGVFSPWQHEDQDYLIINN